MSVPAYHRIIVPDIGNRKIRDSFWRERRGNGSFYERVARNPSTGRLQRAHLATDLGCPRGSEVYPGWRGRVYAVNAWQRDKSGRGPFGRALLIAHGFVHRHGSRIHKHNWYTFYAHNSQLLVAVGEFVDIDTVIALSGDSGSRGQFHVHHELHLDPRYDPGLPLIINPAPGLEKIRLAEAA